MDRQCKRLGCGGAVISRIGYCRTHQMERYLGAPVIDSLAVRDVALQHLGQVVSFTYRGLPVAGTLCGVHGEYVDGYTAQTLRIIWGDGDEWRDYEFNGIGTHGAEMDTVVLLLDREATHHD